MSSRLMIVDDSPVMRSFIRRVVQISGFPIQEIHEATDGLDALEQLQRSPADLVLTDINMPRMDGEELIRAIKTDSRLCDIPIIVVSTDATQHRVESLLHLGARGYLAKPFPPERLSELLEGLLPQRIEVKNV
jgi:two-component system, chemotaxis family, chemotaxis protein CheY